VTGIDSWKKHSTVPLLNLGWWADSQYINAPTRVLDHVFAQERRQLRRVLVSCAYLLFIGVIPIKNLVLT